MSGVLTVARLEFKLRIRAGRWRWLVGAWFVVLAVSDLAGPHRRQPAHHRRRVGGARRTLGAVMFGVVVLVVLALALLVAPALAAQSVNGDRERGTLATLQVTRLRASEIALGKLLASWGTALVFLAVTLPLALWCYSEGGLSAGRIAGVYLVTALLLGVVCAICARAVGAAGPLDDLRRARLPDRVRAGRRHRDHVRPGHRQHPADGHRLLADLRRRQQLHRELVRDDDRPAGPAPGGCSRRTRSWCWPTRPRPARCTGAAAERAGGRGARGRRHPRLAVPRAAQDQGDPAAGRATSTEPPSRCRTG